MTPLVELCELSLVLDARQLLSDISFSISTGEKVAIVGPNGAGKTTILKILSGLIRSYHGSAKISDREIRQLTPDALSKHVSLVPQRLEYVPRFTVGEFFELSNLRDLSGIDPTLPALRDSYLPDLSGGQLQRVVLAGAVAQGAKLLLLDEPTANLDPTGKSEVERVISEYHEQRSIAYVLVTHDLTLAIRNAERMIVLKDGRCMWDGPSTASELHGILQSAYGCRFTRLVDPANGMPIMVSE